MATTYTSTFEGIRIALTRAGAFTTRGAAWAIRSMAAAIVCTPDAESRAAQYKSHLGKTLGYYGSNFTNKNNLGLVEAYESYNSGATTDLSNFMEDSLTMVAGWAYQVANEELGSDRARADGFAMWRMKHIVGRFGTQTGYCYRDAATYTCRYADSDLTSASTSAFNAGVYADWATVYAKTIGANTCGALAEAGIGLAGLANNHAADAGGPVVTAAYLAQAGVTPLGIEQPVVRQVKGVRLAFLAFNAVGSPGGEEQAPAAMRWDRAAGLAAVRRFSTRHQTIRGMIQMRFIQ